MNPFDDQGMLVRLPGANLNAMDPHHFIRECPQCGHKWISRAVAMQPVRCRKCGEMTYE